MNDKEVLPPAVLPQAKQPNDQPGTIGELALLFLRLGTVSFGGPLAHIALMEDEVVTRRRWLDRQHFLDLVGATNLIPGPNSTELAIHIGQLRAGWPGLIVAGTAFILPAMLIVLVLSYLYAHYGSLPQTEWLLYGVKPVVIAIIAQALWKFTRTALKGAFAAVIAIATVALVASGRNEVEVLILMAGIGLIAGGIKRAKLQPEESETTKQSDAEPPAETPVATPPKRWTPAFIGVGATSLAVAPPLWHLFLIFLKIGSVIYGSGYVLLAFLRADLVQHLHWITDRQLVDAVAIGQVTPGPVFTTATFIGYQIAGLPGALVATLGIFLPSFLFVGLLSILMDRLRQSVVMRQFLDAVNATSLALMGLVTYQLLHVSIINVATAVVALASLATLLSTRLNSAWLIAAGAIFGLLCHP
ncbi:MAG: chromate efflux transporter [Abitibacteriaceae bacterium]|nr:chromate efflux transporter [Abditibacteriaceae bacterium]MBV9867420.1 chromate efflux transporter [Abditibacteriaceae bacterium]